MNSEKQSTNLQMILREVNRVGEGQKNVPKLRFKGYEDAWEQRILMNILSEYTDEVNALENGYVRLGIRSHAKGTFHTFVQEGKELQTGKMYKVAANKFIVNITFAWEHAVAVTNQNDEGKIVSHRFPQFTISDDVIPDFFKYIILNKQFKYYLGLSSPGGAGRNRVLNIKEMLKYEVRIATESEQEQIYKILSGIDNLITLHQRKYDALKTMKKTLLSKMFPKDGEDVPEIRFKGFTDAWEQRKLGSAINVRSGKDYKHLDEGDVPVYGTGGYMLSVSEALENTQDAIGIGRKGTIDKPFVLKAPFWTVDTLFYCIPKGNNYLGFLYPLFQSINWKLYDESTGVPSLSKTAIEGVTINLTGKDEQYSIGEYFEIVDTLITLHQRKLDELKNMKKTLLQQMFV